MTIRIQGWPEGTTAPTNVDTAAVAPVVVYDADVLECFVDELDDIYISKTGLDGTKLSWPRRWLTAKILFSPRQMSDTTARASLLAVTKLTYFRIKDTRHILTGTANTVTCVRAGSSASTRNDKTMLSITRPFELISQAPL